MLTVDNRYTRLAFEPELMVLRLMAAARTPVSVVEAAPWLHLVPDCDLNQKSSIQQA